MWNKGWKIEIKLKGWVQLSNKNKIVVAIAGFSYLCGIFFNGCHNEGLPLTFSIYNHLSVAHGDFGGYFIAASPTCTH